MDLFNSRMTYVGHNEFFNRPKDETGKCATSANVGKGPHCIGRLRNDALLPAQSGWLTYSKSERTLD